MNNAYHSMCFSYDAMKLPGEDVPFFIARPEEPLGKNSTANVVALVEQLLDTVHAQAAQIEALSNMVRSMQADIARLDAYARVGAPTPGPTPGWTPPQVDWRSEQPSVVRLVTSPGTFTVDPIIGTITSGSSTAIDSSDPNTITVSRSNLYDLTADVQSMVRTIDESIIENMNTTYYRMQPPVVQPEEEGP